jgi:hypothetical protein
MAISDANILYEAALIHAWPPVARNLVRSLRARGVDHPTSEDIAQEVAERALRAAVPFASAEDLAPWANTVGHRLATDEWRRCAFASCAEVPDAPAVDDVPRRVEARLALEAVEREARTLPPTDRQALAYTVGGRSPVDREEADRWDDRRRRARQALRRRVDGVLDGLVAAVGFVRLKSERLRLRLGVDRAAELLASAGPALLACAVQATAVLVASVDGGRALPPAAAVAVPVSAVATAPQPTAPPQSRQLHAGATGPTPRAAVPPNGQGPRPSPPPKVEVTVPGPPRPTGNTDGRVDDNDDQWRVCVNGNCIQPPLPNDPPVTLPVDPL